jgi:hypothetical protein
MSDPSESAPLDPRQLARSLTGIERELSRDARGLVDQRPSDPEAWFGLVERVAVRLRRTARELETAAPPARLRPPSALQEPAEDEAPPAPALPRSERAPRQRDVEGPQPLSSAASVVAGTATVVPVSELLSFLSGLRRSGVLWVETEREGFLVQLQEGSVVYAQGDNPPQGQLLGEILIAQRSLTRDSLEQALTAAAREKEVLGAYLVREGRITHEDLTRALQTQVQMIFDRMFDSLDARWQFEDGVRMVESADVWLNVIQLLLESARASDESHHAQDQLVPGVPLARIVA